MPFNCLGLGRIIRKSKLKKKKTKKHSVLQSTVSASIGQTKNVFLYKKETFHKKIDSAADITRLKAPTNTK